MKTVPLNYALSDYSRSVLRNPRILMRNRFVETNPVLTENTPSAISRPAMRKLVEVGPGPVRSLFSVPGLFDDDLFVVSGSFLYTVSADLNVTLVSQIGNVPYGDVSWAPVAGIGETPPRLFFAEGGVLWVYSRNSEARGRLEASGMFADGDQVRIGSVYYQFTTGSVDAGSPAGTASNPWLVKANVPGLVDQIFNLFKAINNTGTAGTDYSTALVEHPDVLASAYTPVDLFVAAKVYGTGGNAIVTTETSANAAWVSGTLTGGGLPGVRQVAVPDDAGAVSVASINSYVIVVPVQREDIATVGRFYWIEPGETVIDPINFATAERAPDAIHQVGVFGDLFWLFGAKTTEPWLTTGDALSPMQRYSSILFDRGSWEGTAVQVKDSLIVVDEHGGVFQIQGGQKRISRPDVEERIRLAIQKQRELES